MILALLMFLSSSAFGSTAFLLLAALWKGKDLKLEYFKTPLFFIVMLIILLSLVNFIIYNVVTDGITFNNSQGLIGDYPYAISMLATYVIAVTIKKNELKWLLYLIIIDIVVGIIEYQMGISSFWESGRTFDETSDLLYNRRVCGLDNNSSNFALNMIFGLIIIYLIKPKYQLGYLLLICVGIFVSFNRSYIIASLPLLMYFFVKSDRKTKFIIITGIIILLLINVSTIYNAIVFQFTRGNSDSETVLLTGRNAIWKYFIDFIDNNIIIGNGSMKLWYGKYHAHDSFLWVLASNGLIIALLYFTYTLIFLNKKNIIPILCLLIGSITQSTIYWGLSTADVFLFMLILLKFKEPKTHSFEKHSE